MAEFIYLNASICFLRLHWSVSGSASQEAMRIACEDGRVFHQPFLSAATLDSLIFSPFLNWFRISYHYQSQHHKMTLVINYPRGGKKVEYDCLFSELSVTQQYPFLFIVFGHSSGFNSHFHSLSVSSSSEVWSLFSITSATLQDTLLEFTTKRIRY